MMQPEATKLQGAPLVSVLLVSYNSQRFLNECLMSLQRLISVPFEVVLLDNGSTDHTVQFVRQGFPWVRVFESETNRGFTGGNNDAAKQARGKYLLLLNCDTILLTDVAAGIEILTQESLVGIVGARMYGPGGELRPNTGHFPAPWRLWKFTLQWSKPLATPYGRGELAAFRTDWVEGSFLLTTRENWLAVDGLDEAAFMYGEDVEFCAHTHQRRLLTVQCSKLKYVHYGGYSVERMSYLYAGYRRFHASFSDRATQQRADLVLLTGLLPRIAVFWLLASITRRPAWTRKYKKFIDVLLHWNETAPGISRRRPSAKIADLP